MAEIERADRAFCEAQALFPGSPLRPVFRFLPRDRADQVLAMRALLNMVGGIPWAVSDPAVGLAKLAWWRKECAPESASDSQHPVVRAMQASGVAKQVDPRSLDAYFNGVASTIHAGPCEDVDGLRTVARAVGGGAALLESSCGPDGETAESIRRLGSGRFLLRSITGLPATNCLDAWWVPMDLQARYGVSRQTVLRDAHADGRNGLVRELARLALEWLGSGERDLAGARSAAAAHLLIEAAVERRRLRALVRNPAGYNSSRSAAAEIADVIAAWNRARRLART